MEGEKKKEKVRKKRKKKNRIGEKNTRIGSTKRAQPAVHSLCTPAALTSLSMTGSAI
jgi:hypothetical protein